MRSVSSVTNGTNQGAGHRLVGRRLLVGATVALGGVGMLAGPASAHVTTQDPTAPAGGYFTTAFKVGHGCEDSPTTKIEIKMADGVTSVAPQPVAGWNLSKTERTLDPPLDDHGTKITETTDTVIWEGGNLPDGELQMFWISMKMPEGKAGDVLSFPVIQTCETGETKWIEVAAKGEPEPELPAPSVTLTAAADDGHGDAAGDGDDHAETTEAQAEITSTNGDDAKSDSDDNSSSNGLAIGGLVLGALGLAAGGTALAKTSGKDKSADKN